MDPPVSATPLFPATALFLISSGKSGRAQVTCFHYGMLGHPPENSSGEALFSLEFLSNSSSGNERGWLLTSHRGLERKAQDPSAEIILAREK